jgi:hypothetical protein
MNFYDYADALELQIVIRRRTPWDEVSSKWYAKFDGVETTDGTFLKGEFGNGRTPEEAIGDYINQIRGKRIVHLATSKELRREFTVPRNIYF